ncbi:putative membrane protein [Waddlia chondrophila 2032/99]|uniref:Putative membrane protein n=2 Tax=Waddlia chondrophila TaxID=71667 RepID=D6YWZ8_WADCW|nr:hypothetical protein [Waddlia chondrophila]ADI38659.1 putative membrane protein [Waddlia chondrophila WSU 86-1044]CCB90892.1 putative membrane protein [Waddlia chondrophila 2032/99]
MSKKKAHAISNGIFLIGLGILILTNAWWPGILLALWAMLASRQFLTGRKYQAVLTTVIFLGLFILAMLKFDYDFIAPVMLVIGGIYLIVKEFYYENDTNGEETSQLIKDNADLDDSK